jgi:hypothetical protein
MTHPGSEREVRTSRGASTGICDSYYIVDALSKTDLDRVRCCHDGQTEIRSGLCCWSTARDYRLVIAVVGDRGLPGARRGRARQIGHLVKR